MYDVALDGLEADPAAGSLPNAGMVVPNLCHDAHDSDSISAMPTPGCGSSVGAALSGPDFASGHLAVIVTADEDDHSQGNRILTTLFHPSQHANVVATALTQYSLTRLYAQVLGVQPLAQAATAPDMAGAFGLPLP